MTACGALRLGLLALAPLVWGCGHNKPETGAGDDAATSDTSVIRDDDAGVGDVSAAGDVAAACPDPESTTCIDPAPSFVSDIVPILDSRCNNCHDADLPEAPWPLHDYGDVLAWSTSIGGDLATCSMPPAGSATTLPEAERQKILAWIVCGSPDN